MTGSDTCHAKLCIDIGCSPIYPPAKFRAQLGQTALVKAAGLGRADVVTLLLARGADVNIPDHRGMTAYIFACGAPPPTHVPDARRPRPEARCTPCPPCPISCAVLVCRRAVHHCAGLLCVPLC